jgi:chromosome segregation ATPase
LQARYAELQARLGATERREEGLQIAIQHGQDLIAQHATEAGTAKQVADEYSRIAEQWRQEAERLRQEVNNWRQAAAYWQQQAQFAERRSPTTGQRTTAPTLFNASLLPPPAQSAATGTPMTPSVEETGGNDSEATRPGNNSIT